MLQMPRLYWVLVSSYRDMVSQYSEGRNISANHNQSTPRFSEVMFFLAMSYEPFKGHH